VTYSVAADGPVRIRVYDVAGRLVTTLVDEWRTTGEHSIVWDGNSTAGGEVSAGVYFVALESADGVRTAKVVVLK
jgi:flagellar hook assembly protein FlgD